MGGARRRREPGAQRERQQGSHPEKSACGEQAPLRVGLIGCGRMGMKHASVLSETPGLALVAVCDSSADRLAEVPEAFVPRDARFCRFEELYEQAAVDLAVVATPPVCRLAPVTQALERGIAVLCEKPLATDLGAADRMLEVAARSGTMLAVHHQFRMSAALWHCQSLIASGTIGEVVLVRGRGKAGRSGGIELLEIGTHLADAMSVLAGPPEWCAASIQAGRRLAKRTDVRESRDVAPRETDFGQVVGDRVVASYGFPAGVLGELHFLGYEERMPANYGIDVLGTAGQLALRCSRHVQQPLWHLPRPMEGTPGQLTDWEPIDVAGNGNQGLVEAFYREILRAMRGEIAVPCSGREGRAALAMVLAAYQSHWEGGRRVVLPRGD